MSARDERVQRYYATHAVQEWNRLEAAGDGAIEFALTTRLVREHLPESSRVLDLGGGPGRYTIHLAEQGHSVVLADIVPALLEVAREQIEAALVGHNVEEIVEADACDLSRWPDESFDGVLCLGPFYHLLEAERRDLAACEIARVLRPSGLVFAAFMPRLLFVRRSMVVRAEWPHLQEPEFLRRVLEEGVFFNDAEGRFDSGYGARPEEIAPFFERHGFEFEALIATESIAPPAARELAEMAQTDLAAWAAAIEVLAATASEPSILGAANHLLYVGRKRRPAAW